MECLPQSSSPYQNVPCTPQAISRRSHVFNSPSAIVPQLQTLYSSPIPDYNQNLEYIDEDIPVSPSNRFYTRPSLTVDYSLISEGAATSRVEQVVPGTPAASTQESSPHVFREPLQLPFRLDTWTSATPRRNVSSYLYETPETRNMSSSPMIPSQEESQISLPTFSQASSSSHISNIHGTPSPRYVLNNNNVHLRTPQTTGIESPIPQTVNSQNSYISQINSSRPNVRQTPRRGIDNFNDRLRIPHRSFNDQFISESSQTPRRLNILLQRQTTPYMVSYMPAVQRNITQLDLFNQEEIFG